MKFDSGPLVGTLRSENESGVRLGVIAQLWTSGIFGGAAPSGAATSPMASAASASSSRSFHEPPPPLLTGSPVPAGSRLPA
jgi:hypothetical protein